MGPVLNEGVTKGREIDPYTIYPGPMENTHLILEDEMGC